MQVPIDFVIRCGGAAGSAPLREYAERRLAFALRRLEDRARHLTVRLSDVNGPKGGVDSRCSITLQLRDGRCIGVDATSAWPFAFALIQMKAEMLQKIEAALRRLDQGAYGDCFECGNEIAEARLRALPFAVRCRDCEEVREIADQRERHLLQRRNSATLFFDASN